ncbi:hypothetical protein [Melghirimyces algeriensis]|uniref:Phage holin family Hol44, holin superfamily V n=1 Tax=Melghirimyces algeriensis TaxID=910412 RepID=A0A521C2Z1_9BACL|nr:hypothetical protein [Melghirimyces algeriensis]SMO53100.1 hypothetical protein SAMN06264849_10359 [Melghirimyces algeriensis]
MDQHVYGVALVPLIMGVVELTKLWGVSSKWAALLSVLLGLTAGLTLVSPDSWIRGTIVGLAMGLSASGLYSGVKNTREGVRKRMYKRN